MLQGLPESDPENVELHLSFLHKYFSPNDIMISSWVGHEIKSEKIKNMCHQLYSNPIDNSFESFHLVNRNNKLKQLYTTLVGFKELAEIKKNAFSYDFFIKTRVDAVVEDYGPMIETMLSNPEMIVSSNMFFRNDFPYHFGDIIYGGSASNMNTFISGAFNYLTELDTTSKYCESVLSQTNIIHKAMYKKQDYIIPYSKRKYRWDLNTMPPESVFSIIYLNNLHDYSIFFDSHDLLMREAFVPIDVKKFEKYHFRLNNLKCSINSNVTRKEILSTICTKCHPDLLCNHKRETALVLRLYDSMIDEKVTYNKNLIENCYDALRAPWRLCKEFQNLIEV